MILIILCGLINHPSAFQFDDTFLHSTQMVDKLLPRCLIVAHFFNEFIFQELIGCPSILRSLLQTMINEIAQLLRKTFDFGWIFAHNIMHCFQMWESEERRLAIAQFNDHHSQRPHINFLVIILLTNEFGSHPCRSSDYGLTVEFLFGELHGESEIRDFDVTVV